MGHNWAEKALGSLDGDGAWRRAVEADGPQNLPSRYAGNNLGEDLAESVRLFVCSNGGRDKVYDVMSGQEISGATLRQRYGNRFRVLEAHFDRHPSEMMALKKEFWGTFARVVAVAGGAGVGAVVVNELRKLLDEEEKDHASPVPAASSPPPRIPPGIQVVPPLVH
jgi:hypothetical protein